MKKNFNVEEIENHLIILNSSCTLLIIINPFGEIIMHKKDIIVTQIRGNYISVRENGFMGVYKYDGSIVVPFEFNFIFIKEDGFLTSKGEPNNLVLYVNN